MTSICSRFRPEAFTSSAVTTPPAFSIAPLSSLTAVERAGSSSRTVMEDDTLGTLDMPPIVSLTRG